MDELNTTVADERQRLLELACVDNRLFFTEMLIVFTKFCEREQAEFADSLGFAIRAAVSKDSSPLPDLEFQIEFAGVRYGARRLGDAVLRDGRKLTFLGRNSTATSTFEEVFSDYAAAAGHVLPGLPGKWQDEIDFAATPESRWLAYLFLTEKRTEDHTWLRPISTSLAAVEKLIAGPEKPTAPEKPEDHGPISGNRFHWGDKKIYLPPVEWRIADAMWGRDKRDMNAVIDEVWTNIGDPAPENILPYLSKMNKNIALSGYPKRVSKVWRKCILEWGINSTVAE